MPRPRDKQSSHGLLTGMEARINAHGVVTSYRFHPHKANPINLGRDKNAAIQQVLDLLGRAPDTGTLRYVWGKYTASKFSSRLSPGTQADYLQCWKQLDAVFGHMSPADITSPMVARYVNLHRSASPTRANHEKALLSNLFAMAILLGLCETNPAKQVRPNREEPRIKTIDNVVLQRFLLWVNAQTPQRRVVGLAARFAAHAGCRKAEFLGLTWEQIDQANGLVHVMRAKQRGRNRGRISEAICIGPELAACIADLVDCRRDIVNALVFPTRDGNGYTSTGFKTLWGRVVVEAIKQEIITAEQRFTFHDLRAFYATQHKCRTGQLPDLHKNSATTARIYDRSTTVPRDSQ